MQFYRFAEPVFSLKVRLVRSERAMFKRYVLTLAVVTAVNWTPLEASERWTTQHDPQFGFSFSYPEPLFSSLAGDEKPSFHYFAAKTADAKFLVGAWNNRGGTTPEDFKRWMIANAGGYEDVTYQPHGRSWFVLSGYRDEQIYYEKVMFSCGGNVVNVLAIAYPAAQRELFDPVVERMEDSFRTGGECGHG
jgi:hypothetical protein